jgi:methionyl-tRNA formyltransferase
MRVALIGRSEILYSAAVRLKQAGHTICLIFTAKEAPEYKSTSADFENLAEEWGIPFAQGGRIQDSCDLLRNVGAEIALSVNYTNVIPQQVIDLFPLGILNAHGGDLPRYRGNACQAWAILNGEKRIGLCIHRMIGRELDSGDIIERDYLSINDDTKITQIWDWMVLRIPELMVEAVSRLSAEPDYALERQSIDPKDALRCYPRRPEDGRIDWRQPALKILRLINASNKPYAGAFCNYEGNKLVIWDAELLNCGESFCAVPGQVTEIADGFVDVACGEGKLRLLEVELKDQVVRPSELIKSIRKRLT